MRPPPAGARPVVAPPVASCAVRPAPRLPDAAPPAHPGPARRQAAHPSALRTRWRPPLSAPMQPAPGPAPGEPRVRHHPRLQGPQRRDEFGSWLLLASRPAGRPSPPQPPRRLPCQHSVSDDWSHVAWLAPAVASRATPDEWTADPRTGTHELPLRRPRPERQQRDPLMRYPPALHVALLSPVRLRARSPRLSTHRADGRPTPVADAGGRPRHGPTSRSRCAAPRTWIPGRSTCRQWCERRTRPRLRTARRRLWSSRRGHRCGDGTVRRRRFPCRRDRQHRRASHRPWRLVSCVLCARTQTQHCRLAGTRSAPRLRDPGGATYHAPGL